MYGLCSAEDSGARILGVQVFDHEAVVRIECLLAQTSLLKPQIELRRFTS